MPRKVNHLELAIAQVEYVPFINRMRFIARIDPRALIVDHLVFACVFPAVRLDLPRLFRWERPVAEIHVQPGFVSKGHSPIMIGMIVAEHEAEGLGGNLLDAIDKRSGRVGGHKAVVEDPRIAPFDVIGGSLEVVEVPMYRGEV